MTARALAAVLILCSCAFGIDISGLQRQGYVSDFAGVVDAAAKQDLEQYCARVEKATGAQMAFVTVATLDGDPVENVANSLFRRWGLGSKQSNEGLLLLLVVRDRLSRLEVGYGLEPVITDGTAGELLRQMRPALRENRFGEALGTAAYSLGQRIAQSKNVTIPTEYQPRRRAQEEPEGFPWPVLIFILFILLLMAGGGRRRRYGGGGGGGFLPGLILGSMMNRSPYGGHSRGGFGGYDSGDSFGGFGGGDSGGGGASSNW